MTKKKDFKGLTQSIMRGEIKSIDDFLADSEPKTSMNLNQESNVTAGQSNKDAVNIDCVTVASIKTDSSMPDTSDIEPLAVAGIQEEDKTRLSLFLSIRVTYELERLKTEMRRLAPRSDLSKISKSSIVEAAIDIVAGELKTNGLKGILGKLILKK